MQPVLKCVSLTKGFPGVKALDGLDFEGAAGTVHAVVGENGAGKSTFIKALGGVLRPDSGDIELFGRTAILRSVSEARQRGIGVAYQELSLIPDLSVGQNIWLNRARTNRVGLLPESLTTRKTEELFARIKAPAVDPRRRVKDLSIAARHVVEIASSVALGPKIVVFDEATAALPMAEATWALGLAVELARAGTLVLFISHRLHECREIADDFTVFRRGKAVASGLLKNVSNDEIVEAMLGRKPRMLYPPPQKPPSAEVILEVRDLQVPNEVFGLDFDMNAGEILGLGGLEGQGQSAVMLSLFGMRRHRARLRVAGRQVRVRSPKEAFRAGVGIALVPEDRRYQGLLLDKSVRENIVLAILPKLSRLGFVSFGEEARIVQKAVDSLGIKVSSIEQPARTLSGGNQQKVVVAKLLAVGARVLLFHDLTRGIDVGTKAEVFRLARDLAASGHGILFYSSENQELANMCDRILVMRSGRLASTLVGSEHTEEDILQAALGLKAADAATPLNHVRA